LSQYRELFWQVISTCFKGLKSYGADMICNGWTTWAKKICLPHCEQFI